MFLRRARAPIAIAVAIAIVYWPGLYGFWGRDDFMQHAFADMLLHIAVSLALYRVIRASKIARFPAASCTLVFALHPAVLGTALWWSARFDLLTALFSFVAVRAAIDHVERPRWTTLLA